MVRSGPCRPRRSRTRAWNGHGELLVGEDALLAKLPELFDLLVGFPARGLSAGAAAACSSTSWCSSSS